MGQQLVLVPEDVRLMHLTHGIADDFDHYVTADLWTSVLTDSGTAAVGDAAGGVITLSPSDGTVADNDEAYVKSTAELFLFAANKPIVAEARVKFTEAATNAANVIFGLANAVAANHLQDNGAGPPADYSGCVFHKVDGDTVWNAESSNSTTQKTTNLTSDISLDKTTKTAGGGVWQILRITAIPTGDGLIDFQFEIDGVLVAVHKNRSYANATEMNVFVGVKNGTAAQQTLLVDYIRCHQAR